MNQFLNTKITFFTKINYLLIAILPVALIAGNLIVNCTVILICFFYLIDLAKNRLSYLFKDTNFYFLLLIYFYIIFNSLLISQTEESFIKAVGFLRFIVLAYAISFYFNFFKNEFIKIWCVVFLIVSFDIIFEYIFGVNVLGFKSNYSGRIASFTGDELQIGGYYFGFIFLSLSFFADKKKKLFIFFAIAFLLISLLIGERSNFLKVFIMFLIFFAFFKNMKFFKKILLISLVLIVSIFLINKDPSLKSKFKNHILQPDFLELFNNNKIDNVSLKDVIKENRHFSHYYIAILIFKENYVFGSGFKTFQTESFKKKYYVEKDLHGAGNHPHQIHFEILSELGIVGYILIK